MHSLATRIFVGLLLPLIVADAAQALVTRFGIGGESCGAWTANEASGGSIGQHAWVLGAVSEANIFSNITTKLDFLRSTDANALLSWMNNYCYQYPLNTVDAGVQLLIEELLRRAQNEVHSR